MNNAIKIYIHNWRGATMVEYALVIALVSLIVAGSVGSLGMAVDEMYQTLNSPF